MTKKSFRNITKAIKRFSAITLIIFGFLACSWFETHYSREAKVVNVDGDIITVEDTCGYLWEFEGDGFSVDDEVKLLMDSKHTDSNIYDDEIIDVKIVENK